MSKMFLAIFKMLRLIHTDNLIIISLLAGKDFEDKDIQVLLNSFNEIIEETNEET